MSSSMFTDNRKKDILTLGEETMQGPDAATLAAETKFYIIQQKTLLQFAL